MSDMQDDAFLKKPTRADGGIYWHKSTGNDGLTKYIRADIHEKAVAERDALKAENERLRGGLKRMREECFDDSEWAQIIDKALQRGE